MARPSLSLRSVDPQAVQTSAGVRLERVHDVFWTHVRFHNHVNVICSHMGSPETPTAVQADFAEGIEYGYTAVSVEEIGQLVHLLAHHCDTRWIGFRQSTPRNLVVPVDRAGLVAVQVGPIASESNEVPHSRRAVTASIQSRLRLAHP